MNRSRLPGNYIRSHTGVAAYVRMTKPRVIRGKRVRMVRLQFLGSGIVGQPMRLDAILNDARVKWFKRQPRKCTNLLGGLPGNSV